MSNALALGLRVDAAAIPPVAENTTYVEAGPVVIGVEYRFLDDAILDANYEGTDDQEVIEESRITDTIEDEGLSLHVCDRETGFEYLRFDVFRADPHYHYIFPDHQQIIVFDAAACGDMLAWAIERIRTRLPEMLEVCGAGAVAARIDSSELDAATGKVLELAIAAEERASA